MLRSYIMHRRVRRRKGGSAMDLYPIKLTYHVRTYAFGDRLIPEMLGKRDVPESIVAETWEGSDYRETPGGVSEPRDRSGGLTSVPPAGRPPHDLVTEYPDEMVGEGWRGPHFPLLE